MKRLMKMLLALSLCMFVLVGCAPNPEGDESADALDQTGSDWPKKTITIVVASNPGGDVDFNARAIAPYLEEELGVNVVVSNVAGATAVPGFREVRDADNDGYTVLFGHQGLEIAKAYGFCDFGMEAFELVGTVGKGPGDIIVTGTSKGFENFQDVVDYSAENPGVLTLSVGTGSTTHVLALMMKDAGADLTPADFGGMGEKIAAMLGGHLDIVFAAYGSIGDYIETGELVALGICADERSPFTPDIPTFLEQGFDIDMQPRMFMAFPKATDQLIVDKFAAACEKIITTNEDYKELMATYRTEPFFEGAAKASEFYKEMYEKAFTLFDKHDQHAAK